MRHTEQENERARREKVTELVIPMGGKQQRGARGRRVKIRRHEGEQERNRGIFQHMAVKVEEQDAGCCTLQ